MRTARFSSLGFGQGLEAARLRILDGHMRWRAAQMVKRINRAFVVAQVGGTFAVECNVHGFQVGAFSRLCECGKEKVVGKLDGAPLGA